MNAYRAPRYQCSASPALIARRISMIYRREAAHARDLPGAATPNVNAASKSG